LHIIAMLITIHIA